MTKLSGYPFAEIQFTKEGKIHRQQEKSDLIAMIQSEKITDLIIISHGWNNDIDEARKLYRNLTSVLSSEGKMIDLTKHKIGILGILWPSKKFAEDELIAGGAASARNPEEKDRQMLVKQCENLKQFFDKANDADKKLETAKKLVNSVKKDKDAGEKFVSLMNDLLTKSINQIGEANEENRVANIKKEHQKFLLERLSDVGIEHAPENGNALRIGTLSSPSATGHSAGIGEFIGDIFSGALNLLNFVTYYQMKERAGRIGVTGVHDLLFLLRKDFPKLRLHLIGHSFGCRLLTSAVLGKSTNKFKVENLMLLQGAFSHFGFAKKYDGSRDGAFRGVVTDKKVNGPILISCTHNDKAVGLAYAIASRLARQIGAFVGDKEDPYGGLGGNGAQKTPEVSSDYSLKKNEKYSFQKGKIYNLNADACINSHSDICKKEVAQAFWSAFPSS